MSFDYPTVFTPTGKSPFSVDGLVFFLETIKGTAFYSFLILKSQPLIAILLVVFIPVAIWWRVGWRLSAGMCLMGAMYLSAIASVYTFAFPGKEGERLAGYDRYFSELLKILLFVTSLLYSFSKAENRAH